MSNEDKSKQEDVFAHWLDDKQVDISEVDELWVTRSNTVNSIDHQVEMHVDRAVPEWDRESTFHSDKAPFWQWRGLPALSMAFSIFAVALVLFKVEIAVQDNGLLVNFGGNTEAMIDKKVALLVNSKLQSFAHEQQLVLADYAADIKAKQQDSNLQLASYIMGASRQERKEDFSDFIQYINAQRKDEKLEQRIKYQQLEHAIKASSSYQTTGLNNVERQQNSTKSIPTLWNTKE